MKKWKAVLTAAVLAVTAIPQMRLHPQAADTIKIMPVGDSITEGVGENGGYRKYLDYFLKQKNIAFDLVGPKNDGQASFNYKGQNVSYDGNHAGYSGFQIKQIPDWGRQQGNTGSLYNELKNNNTVGKFKPDIILLIIGTNDMTANRSMDDCANDLRDLVDYMLADMAPNGTVFMGSIPEFTAYGGNAQRVGNYNGTVKKVAEEYANKGKNVRFADVHGCLNGTADLGFDQLHPNGGGYEKMGKFWSETLEEFLQSSVETTTTTTTTTTETTTTTTTTTTETTTTTTSTETTTVTEPLSKLRGDVDCNGKVAVADAVLLARYIAEDPVTITAQGLQNAEVDGNAAVLSAEDLVVILQVIAGMTTL